MGGNTGLSSHEACQGEQRGSPEEAPLLKSGALHDGAADVDNDAPGLLCYAMNATTETEVKHVRGLIAIACSAVAFGINSVFIKSIGMDTLIMMEIRIAFQYIFSLGAVLLVHRSLASPPSGVSSAGMLIRFGVTKDMADFPITERLFGPPERRWRLAPWVLCYSTFNILWFSTLRLLPLGDATAIVYCQPIFAVTFAYFLLDESPQVPLIFLAALITAASGVLLITKPVGLFNTGSNDDGKANDTL